MACLRGHKERSRQTAQKETGRMGHTLLLGSLGGMFWGSWAEAELVS